MIVLATIKGIKIEYDCGSNKVIADHQVFNNFESAKKHILGK